MESVIQSPEINVAPPVAGKSAKVGIILVVLAGLLVGGGVGTYVAGPAIAAKFAGKPSPSSAATTAEHAKDAVEGGAKVLRVIDNLVLNPAGSGGTRFLMLTATLEVKDAAAEEMLKSRDAEVRDAMLSYFGRKTVEELTDMSRREDIKKELMAVLAKFFPAGTIKAVYFPQFVIQ